LSAFVWPVEFASMKSRTGRTKRFKIPTYKEVVSAACPGQRPVGEVPQQYAHSDHRRIFLDTDNLRKWDTGLYQRFPQAEKVVVTGLEPGPAGSWDSRLTEVTGSVLVEDGRFRMWYICMPEAESHDENADHNFTCYAESDDGIHWRKPDLGITAQQRYPGNNLLPLPGHVIGVVPALPKTGSKYLAATIQINPLEPDITDQKKWGFHYNGDELFVNARCPEGRIRVALLEHGTTKPLPGFSLDDCVPITGDHIRAPFRFKNAPIASIAADTPLTIRFELSRSEVFAYEWV
jgi:hypothetical protein